MPLGLCLNEGLGGACKALQVALSLEDMRCSRRSECPGRKHRECNDATEQSKSFNVLQHDFASDRCFIPGNQIASDLVGTCQRWPNEGQLRTKDTYYTEQDQGDSKAKHRTIWKRNAKANRSDTNDAWRNTKYDTPRPHYLKLGPEHR